MRRRLFLSLFSFPILCPSHYNRKERHLVPFRSDLEYIELNIFRCSDGARNLVGLWPLKDIVLSTSFSHVIITSSTSSSFL